jgi:hypothetical protein
MVAQPHIRQRADLAERFGVCVSTIDCIEAGKIHTDV